MLNSTTWLYGAEVLPVAIRSKVMGLAAASHFIVNVGSKSSCVCHVFKFFLTNSPSMIVTEAGPTAYATIGQNYYYVFVACTLFFLVMAYLYFP